MSDDSGLLPAILLTEPAAPVPAVIAARGHHARRRFVEFFTANIRNSNTRKAYYRAASGFFDWCEQARLGLLDIEPVHVAAWVESLGRDFSPPSVKQALAAVRVLFDWLVVGQVLAVNPAAAVRGPKYVVRVGKTPVLAAPEARQLLDSINTATVVGLRDRALIGLLVFTFARIGAALGMTVADVYTGSTAGCGSGSTKKAARNTACPATIISRLICRIILRRPTLLATRKDRFFAPVTGAPAF
jgi:site-specific recombinase XerD